MKKCFLILLLLLGVLTIIGLAIIHKRGQRLDHQLDQARSLLGTKQGGQLLEDLARNYPDHAEVQYLSARQLRLQGGSDQALVCCRRAAELGYPAALINREML